MKEIYLKAFNAITEFVDDLWEVYGKKSDVTPLRLYKRLIEHITLSDKEAITKAVNSFQKFVKKYDSAIIKGELDKIPRGEVIPYGDNKRVVIEIQKFIHKGDLETKTIIRQYLLTINAILNPSNEAIEELEKKKQVDLDDSPEGKFLTGVLKKAKGSMQDIQTDNPAIALTSLAQSGVIQELFTGLQQGMGSGEMDFGRLVGSMQGALGNLMQGMEMPEQPKPASVEEVVDEPPSSTTTSTVEPETTSTENESTQTSEVPETTSTENESTQTSEVPETTSTENNVSQTSEVPETSEIESNSEQAS